MTELQELQRFLRVVYLRKSLYYSILLLLFSVVEAIALALYNHYFIPELVAFRKIVVILLVLTLTAFLFWPIRYLIQAIWTNYYSLNRVAKSLKSYDNGRLDELTGLSKNELDKWAQVVVLKKVYLELPVFKTTLKKNIPFSTIIGALALLVLTILISPKLILTEGKDEIVSGTYTREAILLDINDTVHTLFNEVLELSHPRLTPFYKGSVAESILIRKNETIDWELNGRFYRRQTVVCDSVPILTSWSATIKPPDYLKLSTYITQDTIKAFKGSLITLEYQGVLKDKIAVNVSRETNSRSFKWDGAPIELKSAYWTTILPTVELTDASPSISVLTNTNDSLIIQVTDDYGLMKLSIDTREVQVNGLTTVVSLSWGSRKAVVIKAFDNNKNGIKRELRRPVLNATDLLKEASDQALKSTITDNQEETLKEFRNKQLSEEQNEKVKDVVEKNPLQIEVNEEIEPLDELLQRLDELWRMEEAIELLSMVDSLRDEGLDSAVFKAAESLEDLSIEKLQPAIEGMKGMDKEGENREKQAKASSDKLKELLATSTVEVQEDNVARIKRLLKNGWLVSVAQENLQKLATAVNKARSQQLVLANEKAIKDTLDLLLIHEPLLSQLLSEKRMSLSSAMRTIESKMTAGKNMDADIGYAITALNDINQALYFILESEKSSLNQAKKDCKKGKPGTSGKPSSAGEGKEGKKGTPKPSKKPGGRKKGRTGEPKEGQEGSKPGSSGKPGEKELLKRIEAAKEEIVKSSDRSEELLENIERLKEEVLFKTELTERDLNELEERLWRVEESVFNKKELGESRDSESGNESKSKGGESIDFKVLKSKETDLPLPVLKKL